MKSYEIILINIRSYKFMQNNQKPMSRATVVCIEHIIVVSKILWCHMNYYGVI